MTRRNFLAAGAKLGAALATAPYLARGAASDGKAATLNLALIGCGDQGRVLLAATLKIPGIRWIAVCDIWPYHRAYAERILKKFGHAPQSFEDYREMLAACPDLDAVLVATPDFMHAEHSNAALRAGKHVYCEKLMANTVEGARSMVMAARETGRLLQIGHQRRSNPRYLYARDRIVRQARLLGRMTNVSGQWNRAVAEELGFPASQGLSPAKLRQYGYADMREFRNWRWFKRYGGGPISDLGAHQIDVFNWMLGAVPRSVMAAGGADYYRGRDWYDNVTAILEYELPAGLVRAVYGVLTTTSAGAGPHEYFMGDEGALKISEDARLTRLYREARAPDWEKWVDKKVILRSGSQEIAARARKSDSAAVAAIDIRETAELSSWGLPVTLNQPIHQPHLENFFGAIRHGTPLNCPAESAFATAVSVLKINEAVAARTRLGFESRDFVAE